MNLGGAIPQMALELTTTKTASTVISVLDIHHGLGTGDLPAHKSPRRERRRYTGSASRLRDLV